MEAIKVLSVHSVAAPVVLMLNWAVVYLLPPLLPSLGMTGATSSILGYFVLPWLSMFSLSRWFGVERRWVFRYLWVGLMIAVWAFGTEAGPGWFSYGVVPWIGWFIFWPFAAVVVGLVRAWKVLRGSRT